MEKILRLLVDINRYNINALPFEYTVKFHDLKKEILNLIPGTQYFKGKRFIRQEFTRYKVYEEFHYSEPYFELTTYPASIPFSNKQKAVEYLEKLYQRMKSSIGDNRTTAKYSDEMFIVKENYQPGDCCIYYVSESSKVRSILSEFKIQVDSEEHTIHQLDYSCVESQFGKEYENIDEESFEKLWASMDRDTPLIDFSLSDRKQIPKDKEKLQMDILELESLIKSLLERELT